MSTELGAAHTLSKVANANIQFDIIHDNMVLVALLNKYLIDVFITNFHMDP